MPNDRVITRENLLKYDEVRKSGKYDMLMRQPPTNEFVGLSRALAPGEKSPD